MANNEVDMASTINSSGVNDRSDAAKQSSQSSPFDVVQLLKDGGQTQIKGSVDTNISFADSKQSAYNGNAIAADGSVDKNFKYADYQPNSPDSIKASNLVADSSNIQPAVYRPDAVDASNQQSAGHLEKVHYRGGGDGWGEALEGIAILGLLGGRGGYYGGGRPFYPQQQYYVPQQQYYVPPQQQYYVPPQQQYYVPQRQYYEPRHYRDYDDANGFYRHGRRW